MKSPPERDPVLRMVDAILGDLSVRSAMYVGRRSEDGDTKSFVIQTGEKGRCRLGLPDLASAASIQRAAVSAQAHVAEAVGAPVPLCPQHHHALRPHLERGQLTWKCPDGEWQCGLGEYAELSWPQFDADSLAPILAGRLQRRGISGWVTFGVRQTEQGPLAEFGVPEQTPGLIEALRAAAAPCCASPVLITSGMVGRHLA